VSTVYRIGHLERLTLKTPYPAQIERIRFIMGRLPRETSLVVDFTGVGRGIYDMLVDAGLSPIGVTIHSGFEVHSNGNVFSVPKSTIVSTLVARLHSGELVVHKDLKHWPVLRRELLNFRPEITRTGQETWNARSGEHDDLVLALGLPVMVHVGQMRPWRWVSACSCFSLALHPAPNRCRNRRSRHSRREWRECGSCGIKTLMNNTERPSSTLIASPSVAASPGQPSFEISRPGVMPLR